jgi:hypothetical protein
MSTSSTAERLARLGANSSCHRFREACSICSEKDINTLRTLNVPSLPLLAFGRIKGEYFDSFGHVPKQVPLEQQPAG